jgi:type VI protein secretion system component VasK
MSTGITRGILAGALWLLADAAPVWPQSANTAALVNSFIGVGEQATSTLNSMAMQRQALEMQREQMQAQRQQQQQALEQRALEREQAAAQRHHCQPGYTGALIVHADRTRELICEQRR